MKLYTPQTTVFLGWPEANLVMAKISSLLGWYPGYDDEAGFATFALLPAEASFLVPKDQESRFHTVVKKFFAWAITHAIDLEAIHKLTLEKNLCYNEQDLRVVWSLVNDMIKQYDDTHEVSYCQMFQKFAGVVM